MATKVKLVADGVVTADQLTLTTAATGTNTTAPATTAFVQQEISALVDSSPGTLNTLNELAAALGDDANFSTTVTNSIATKAPLASPDFTGDATFDTSTLKVDSTNNRVGIGTTNPTGKLGIYGGGINDIPLVITHAWGSSSTALISASNASSEVFKVERSGNVGIGTDSPSELLHIYNLSNDANVLIEGNGPGANAKLTIDGHVSGGQLHLTYRSDTQSKTVAMECLNDGSFTVDTLGSERMRIDDSGNLLVGKTSPLTTSVGAEIRPIGFITSFRTSDAPALFARGTDDGDIVVFRKDSTTVGVIGTEGTDLTIGSGGAGFQFLESENKIRPFNVSTNSASNGVVDLGRANANFKDLYISGAIKMDSDLDDYEEGTWTPTYQSNNGLSSVTGITSASGTYVKVGNIVHIAATFTLNGSSSNNIAPGDCVRISGQPFQSSMAWISQPGTVYTTNAFTNLGGFNGACYRYSSYYVVQFLGQGNASWSGDEANTVYMAQTFII